MNLISLFATVCPLFFALVINSCAKEVSDEDRRREESDRELHRLSAAEGQYAGFVEMNDRDAVPFTVNVIAKKNPQGGDVSPTLTASINLGLFGGVTLVAQSVNFDWGVGTLTAVFSKSAGTGSGEKAPDSFSQRMLGSTTSANSFELELTGLSDKKSFKSGIIKAARLSEKKLVSTAENSYANSATEFQLPLTLAAPGMDSRNAILSLQRVSKDQVASSDSDMPSLPALEASLVFTRASQIKMQVGRTIFDPLKGTLDLVFRDNSWLRLSGVFARISGNASQLIMPSEMDAPIAGDFIVDGKKVYSANLFIDHERLSLGAFQPQPVPRYFVGTYKGSEAGLTIHTFAVLEDSGSVVTNPAEIGFAEVPDLRMRLVRCVDGVSLSTFKLRTFSIDFVRDVAVFSDVSSASLRLTEISISKSWQVFDGVFQDTNGGSSTSSNATFHLEAAANQAKEPSCGDISL